MNAEVGVPTITKVPNYKPGELFENLRACTIVQSKNGGSKRGREVGNDEGDFKKSKKQKLNFKIKKTIRNLQDRVAVVEGKLTSLTSDIDELKGMMSTILKHIVLQRKVTKETAKEFEGLVVHTLESEEVDNAKTEDVDTSGTLHWLRMPKEDDTSNGAKHIELKNKDDEDVQTVGTPPWLTMPNEDDTSNVVKFNIELEKPIDVLEKKVEIGLEESIDVVDDEVEIEDSGKKLRTHFHSDVTEIEPFPTQRPHVQPARRKCASLYLSTPFTTLPKRLRAWITDKRTNDKVHETFHGKKSKIFFRDMFMCRQWLANEHLDALFLFICFKIMSVGIPSAQNFTIAYKIFMRLLVAKWSQYKECIKENRPFDWKEKYSCQVKVWDLLLSLTSAEEMRNILLPIRELVANLLDSTGFFARRGGSSTYKEPWPVVIVDSISLDRNNSDYGIFTIKYFEYIAAGFDLDTLCQENMSYFRK
ncbi:Ulp1-like peptidase [Cucumis melo var. makuwa]|uniref:Ulp1-like peptidase n=1 Tax=Cucumis melo var. makuwa TaxID=1194695 RepID=A0A5A7UB98_CUCMM|nr:Ulp1-like peptidase [Cucumis melo var. makuwa]TYJ97954.1 Ulp1-like peptidase [Cucumis melo var. makuwa]